MNHANPSRVAQRHLAATRTAGADEITSRLKGIKLGPGGGVRSVEKLTDTEWVIEPSHRQRLDHFGNDGEKWDKEGWDETYSAPLTKAAQGWLDTTFKKGQFDTDVGEKGHLYVRLTNAGKAHFDVSGSRAELLPLLGKTAAPLFHKDDVEGLRKAFGEMTLSERAKGKAFLQKAAKELAKLTGYPFVYNEEGIGGGNYGVGWAASATSGRVSLRMEIRSYLKEVDWGYTQPSGMTVGTPFSKLGFVGGSSISLGIYEGELKGTPTLRTLKGLIDKMGGVEKLVTLLGGPVQGRHSGLVTIPLVKAFVERQRTYFDLEDESPTSLSYGTREGGDIGDERPGEGDLRAAGEMVRALRNEFGKAIKARASTVDEWVSFTVTLSSV